MLYSAENIVILDLEHYYHKVLGNYLKVVYMI